jgi:hypothetical protein
VYLWSDFLQLVIRPFAGLARIRDRRQLQDGLRAFGLSLLASTLVAEIAAIKPYAVTRLVSLPADFLDLESDFIEWLNDQRFALPIYVSIGALLLWILAVAIVHVVARRLGGRGTFAGYMKITGYIALIGLIAQPLSLLQALSRAGGLASIDRGLVAVMPFLSLAVFVWQNVLYILAAQVHYSISPERATAAVVGPIGCGLVLLFALVIGAAAFAVVRAGL